MKNSAVVVGLVSCVVAAAAFASALWTWVLRFDPGFNFTHAAVATGPALTSSVTVLLIDGLRLDASRRMRALNVLRARGADIEGEVGTPSFSRPGRATLAVGAPPDIHGVTTNRQSRALAVDNLFRQVAAASGACRVAGSAIWPGLFGGDIVRCGVYQAGLGKEGPGAFIRQVAEVRAGQERGLDFILEQPAMLRVADIISTDFAAHEYGAASSEYAAEVERADEYVRDLSARLDLSKTTLVVTADHGHRDLGGHGGEEPDVLAIPIVMVGAGIAQGATARAVQADVAPTIAALLGLALPTGSSGHPLFSVLAADEDKLESMKKAAAVQEQAFDRAAAEAFGRSAGEEARTDWRALRHSYRDAAVSRRTPLALFGTFGLAALVMAVAHLARPGKPGPVVGALVGTALWALWARWLQPPLSLSAINYDEMLLPFFGRIMSVAAMIAAISMAAAIVAGERTGMRGRTASWSGLAGFVSLLESSLLLAAATAAWLHHGLLLRSALPAPARLVEAYALALSALSVAGAGLIAMTVLRRSGRGADASPRTGEAGPPLRHGTAS